MERIKRRRRETKKRHQRRVKKQELQIRIRQLQNKLLEDLRYWLVLHCLWDSIVERLVPPKGEGRKHKKLNLEERQRIYKLHSQRYGVNEIARRIERSNSTVSRELKRNQPPRFLHGLDSWSRAKQADDLAQWRRQKSRSGRVRLKSLAIEGFVFAGIKAGLTPELVSARLFMEHGVRLSHEAMYRWIYEVRRELIEFLPRKGKRYRRGGKRKRRILPQPAAPKLSIEKRPKAINERWEFGHWEVDTIVSKQSKSCLLVLQERSTRFFFVVKLPNCTAEEASREIIRLLSTLDKQWVKSLTCDNGSENWEHELISETLGIPVYFCHPYCSSERGGVENRNGVLRRFFPKKTDFELVTDQELERVWQQLIHRPMRCLDYFTPYEIFNETFEPILKLAA